MKKNFFIIITSMLLITIFLAACDEIEEAADDSKVQGGFATGSSGGLYDLIGGGMADVINKNNEEIDLTTTAPPSISEVPRLIDSEQALIGIGMADMMERAKEGTGEFDESYENVQPVLAMYDNVMALVTAEDSSINNIEDLEGKTVGVSSESTKSILTSYVEAAGISQDDVEWSFLSYEEQAEALKDNDIDAGNFTAFPKAGLLEDLASSPTGMKIVDIDKDLQEDWDEEYPLWANGEIPGGTYKGIDEDKQFYTQFTVLYANGDMSEEAVYNITKTIFENQEDIDNIHPAAEDITPEKTEEYVEDEIINPEEIHPGAKKYFEEEGVL